MKKLSTPKPVQDYLDRGFSRKDAERLVQLNDSIQRTTVDLRGFADSARSFFPNGVCTDSALLARVSESFSYLSQLVLEHNKIMSEPFLSNLRESLNHVGCNL